jgi:hypothetical protein
VKLEASKTFFENGEGILEQFIANYDRWQASCPKKAIGIDLKACISVAK